MSTTTDTTKKNGKNGKKAASKSGVRKTDDILSLFRQEEQKDAEARAQAVYVRAVERNLALRKKVIDECNREALGQVDPENAARLSDIAQRLTEAKDPKVRAALQAEGAPLAALVETEKRAFFSAIFPARLRSAQQASWRTWMEEDEAE